jgi:flagellar biosynthetic protein FliP
MDSTNPFAAPGSMGIVDIVPTSGAYWHEGKLLVALPNAELPARCPKCNVPVDDHRKRYNLSWYPPIAYAGLLLGVLPFLLIDMVVATVLLSMGMMQLPPVMVSMPFKILLFIMVDGWNLVVGSLVKSFY